MKTVRFISSILGTMAMFLLFCISAPVRAQEEHPQEAKPAEGAPHDQETKPSEEAKPPRDEAKPSEAKPKDEKSRQENTTREEKTTRDNKTGNERTETRTQTQTKTTVKHGVIENGRIPDAQFHAHFGREHHFRVGHPVVVEGQSRFQYGDYWFGWSEAWPVGWGYDNDFYVDFIDGQYYLIDLSHPEVRIALVLVM